METHVTDPEFWYLPDTPFFLAWRPHRLW